MRIFTILVFFIAFSPLLHANEVDELKTDKDVENFIHTHAPALADARIAYKDFLYPDAIKQMIADSLGVKLWQKVDFNNDGHTDLLVYISTNGQNYLTAFIDENGSFKTRFISRWPFAEVYYPVVKKEGDLTVLLLYKMCGYCHSKKEGISGEDSLVYKFGNFIEHVIPVSIFTSHKIERIEFSTSPCYGTCPVFELDINADRKAQYHAISYNDTTGTYSAMIDRFDYTRITDILNYIDFPNLRDDYHVVWTDDQACSLTITYDDGKVKKISDYGEIGTHGLNMVYSLLYDLRKNQAWKLVAHN
jgi:hypothetical protein